jgi:hypothetical protein
MTFKEYIKEIEKGIRDISNFSYFLSFSDLELIKNWYNKKIPLDTIKQAIYKEMKNIPPYRRNRFSLKTVAKHLEKQPKRFIKPNKELTTPQVKREVIEIDLDDSFNRLWKEVFERYGLCYKEGLSEERLREKVINHIWKNVLTGDEKKELERRVLTKVKREFNLSNIDLKKVLKKKLAEEIQREFNIP